MTDQPKPADVPEAAIPTEEAAGRVLVISKMCDSFIEAGGFGTGGVAEDLRGRFVDIRDRAFKLHERMQRLRSNTPEPVESPAPMSLVWMVPAQVQLEGDELQIVVPAVRLPAAKAEAEIERLKEICVQLAGEETLHQDGRYETEMGRLWKENEWLKKLRDRAVQSLRYLMLHLPLDSRVAELFDIDPSSAIEVCRDVGVDPEEIRAGSDDEENGE